MYRKGKPSFPLNPLNRKACDIKKTKKNYKTPKKQIEK
jgi:hypothetical protein